jgi:2-phosphosulfolactate phosphatase
MTEPERPAVFVHLLPVLIPPGALKGSVAVVVDVLRATTVMVHALASGAEAIVPCGEIDEARRVALEHPGGSTVLGGERQGLPIEGFDLGNSPSSYTPEVCGGKTVIMTTTNGTRAILASLEAERVLVAAFANLRATVESLLVNVLKVHALPIHIVCAGTDGWVSHEDTLLAGALASGLADDWEIPLGNDEAVIAVSHWRATAHRIGREPLIDFLAQGRGGRRVFEIGLGDDLADAARVDRFPLVAELRREPLKIIRVE